MTKLILYHSVPSRGMTVHWLLEELGVPFELKMLNLDAKEQKAPEYLAINPMGRVPALRHGDTIVTETAAICTYLAETFADAGLDVPIGSPLRGDYLRWMFFAPVTAEPAIFWKALGNVTTERDYLPFADIGDVAATLQSALRGREFIVGDRFSAADVMLGSTIMWATRLMPVMPQHPELTDYWDRLEQRPGWQRAHERDERYLAGLNKP